MRLTALCCLGLVLTSPPCSLTAQTGPPFKMLEPSGPYAVGLRVVEQYDYSRVFQPAIDEFGKPYTGERARPLQTLAWYPAQLTDTKPMLFGDYVALKATETSFGSPKQLTGYRERMIASMTPYLASATLAHRDAPFDAAATTFLRSTPHENGVPAHTMGVQFRRATPSPESFASFRVRVGQKGFDHVTQIYAAVRQRQPDFKLTPEITDSWAYQLAAGHHFPEAVDVSRLVLQLDDSSSAAFTHLGEMYAKAGQKQEAVASYERALERDTANVVAKRSLEQLGGSPARR
jgi:tetratricopeptide (TPR) repeat protein